MVDVKQLTPLSYQLGEGPYWDETNQYLLFVDIMKGDVHRHYPDNLKQQTIHVEEGPTGDSVSFALPVEGKPSYLVVGLGRSLALVEWPLDAPDTLTVKAKAILHSVDQHSPTNRFNDGKCDPMGRIWAGTMAAETAPGVLAKHKAALYTLNTDLSIATGVDKISLSNGLAWNKEATTMYYIDSTDYAIYAFNYNAASGKIDNRRTVLDYKAASLGDDIPDGMTIDNNGNLWVANFYGHKVICIDPQVGKIIRQVSLPASNITSVCWGGTDYSTLYVTSSQVGISEDKVRTDKAQGGVFAVTGLGAQGAPPTNFKVDLSLLKSKIN
ncbi:hypothetical protein Pmani_005828 [Petrolisthes manimaculis]|uniref:Regucalcin n=1 Tax=Petrolisthes manimaculis TaxID=1843537 RepID=A0AAE1UH41_9EUCA|nr:hypothetical protein Pmani_005828 [Petrolisthes manimaculis]